MHALHFRYSPICLFYSTISKARLAENKEF